MPGGLKSGYLIKRALGGTHKWQKRFFIVSTVDISYYKNATHTSKPNHTFRLSSESTVKTGEDCAHSEKTHCFEVATPTEATLNVHASSEEELGEWINAINTVISDLKAKSDELTSENGNAETRGQLVEIISAAEKKTDADEYYEVTVENKHAIDWTYEKREDWSTVHVSDGKEVEEGSVLTSIGSTSVILTSFEETKEIMEQVTYPVVLKFLRPLTKEGTLEKQCRGAGRKYWKEMWFRLKGGKLQYFDKQGSEKVSGELDLNGGKLSPCGAVVKSENALVVTADGKVPLIIKARTHDELIDWASCIFHATTVASGGGYIRMKHAQTLAEEADGKLDQVTKLRAETDAGDPETMQAVEDAEKFAEMAHKQLETVVQHNSRKQSTSLLFTTTANALAQMAGQESSEQRVADNMQRFFQAKGDEEALQKDIDDNLKSIGHTGAESSDDEKQERERDHTLTTKLTSHLRRQSWTEAAKEELEKEPGDGEVEDDEVQESGAGAEVAEAAGATGAGGGSTEGAGADDAEGDDAEGDADGTAAEEATPDEGAPAPKPMSIGEMKRQLDARGVDYSRFIEKMEFVEALAQVATKRGMTQASEAAMTHSPSELDMVKLMKDGATQFNMEPKKGIQFLVQKGVLKMEPRDVAKFLREGKGLGKRPIGEYLAKFKDFNERVLDEYVQLLDFSGGLLIDDAVRKFIQGFRLPGESQQIDRLLECFARKYCENNPGVFEHPDVAYVLAFSVIMLNTDLHNRNLKEASKMTLKQYNRSLQGINQGKDLDADMVEQLYNRIKTNEIKMGEADMYESEVVTFMAPTRSGWLYKQGVGSKIRNKWKKHWFLVSDNCLYYFLNQSDPDPRCIIPLENCEVKSVKGNSKQFVIAAMTKGDMVKSVKVMPDGTMKQGRHASFNLRAETTEERDEWVATMGAELAKDGFYDALKQKKEVFDKRVGAKAHQTKPAVEGWMDKKVRERL
jgi:cytohesin